MVSCLPGFLTQLNLEARFIHPLLQLKTREADLPKVTWLVSGWAGTWTSPTQSWVPLAQGNRSLGPSGWVGGGRRKLKGRQVAQQHPPPHLAPALALVGPPRLGELRLCCTCQRHLSGARLCQREEPRWGFCCRATSGGERGSPAQFMGSPCTSHAIIPSFAGNHVWSNPLQGHLWACFTHRWGPTPQDPLTLRSSHLAPRLMPMTDVMTGCFLWLLTQRKGRVHSCVGFPKGLSFGACIHSLLRRWSLRGSKLLRTLSITLRSDWQQALKLAPAGFWSFLYQFPAVWPWEKSLTPPSLR